MAIVTSALFNMKVLGSPQAVMTFNIFNQKIKKRILRRALRTATEPVLETARVLVPVRTGALREGLRLRVKSAKDLLSTAAIVATPTRKKLNIPSKSKGYYPAAMEFGWRTKSGKKIPPRPYLRPALYRNSNKVIMTFREEMRKGVQREARRLRRKFDRQVKSVSSFFRRAA